MNETRHEVHDRIRNEIQLTHLLHSNGTKVFQTQQSIIYAIVLSKGGFNHQIPPQLPTSRQPAAINASKLEYRRY